MKYHDQKSRTWPPETALLTPRMWSDWLAYPAYQWFGSLCGATREVAGPLKSSVNVGPGLRNVS